MTSKARIIIVIYIVLIAALLTIIAFSLAFLNLNGTISLPFSPTFLYRYDRSSVDKATESTVKLLCTYAEEEPCEQGSGFFALEPGVIVTCYHVIETGSYSISAEMHKDRCFLFVESVIGYSKEDDIAFLRCIPTDVPLLEFTNASDLKNNQLLIAIGSPNGHKDTMSYGTCKRFDKFVYSTAEIMPGSSGGPLLNSAGKVVGINAGTTDGLCCSIPSEKVLEVWNSLNPECEMPLTEFAESNGNCVPDTYPHTKIIE